MVEIIPKRVAKLPLWLGILFYVSITILLVSVLALFFLSLFQKRASQTLQNLEAVISQKKPSQELLEKEVFSCQEKINDFSVLVAEHQVPLNFFSFLEKLCHPQVQFTELSLNSEELRAGLSGNAESFQTLGQQILIFKKAPEIKSVHLSKISIRKEGGALFSLSLFLAPEVFK